MPTNRSTPMRTATPPSATGQLAQKAFKPIPADRPAKELGEYLRTLVRSTNLKLDAIAAHSGLAKSTMSTTMNGTSKTRQSVQDVLDALQAVGRQITDDEAAEVWRLYDVGRQNLAAQRDAGPDASRTDPKPASVADDRVLEQPTPMDIAVWASTTGGMEIPLRDPIELPRRVPGQHIQQYQDQTRAAVERARRQEAWRTAHTRRQLSATGTAQPAVPHQRAASADTHAEPSLEDCTTGPRVTAHRLRRTTLPPLDIRHHPSPAGTRQDQSRHNGHSRPDTESAEPAASVTPPAPPALPPQHAEEPAPYEGDPGPPATDLHDAPLRRSSWFARLTPWRKR
jgi:transcriptional regulator with XRE-family HTH domain